MESDMVNRLINNRIDFQDANEAFQYLKDTLKLDYPSFIITSESFNAVSVSKFGLFEIWLEYNGVQFKIGCERGVLLHQVNKGKEELRLHHFDKGMNDVLAFSRKNIQYTISVFKRFVEEQSPS